MAHAHRTRFGARSDYPTGAAVILWFSSRERAEAALSKARQDYPGRSHSLVTNTATL